jgi:hypothetical protein
VLPLAYRQLSTLDQYRVNRFLVRGVAPDDRELAATTLAAAEYCQSQSRVVAAVYRWVPMLAPFCIILPFLPSAFDGHVGATIFVLFILSGVVANLMLNPWTRPKNVARSLEASKRLIAPVSRDRSATIDVTT